MIESPTKQRSRPEDPPPFRIDRDGVWFYHDSPILRKPLVKLFASVLTREEDGTFWLVTPVERVAVIVVDAPFTVVQATRIGQHSDQKLELRTNVEDIVVVDNEHPIYVQIDPNSGQPTPYAVIRNGLTGLITRSVFYDLVNWAEEDEDNGDYFVHSMNERFFLGNVTQDHESVDA